jgi:hypothetical protein
MLYVATFVIHLEICMAALGEGATPISSVHKPSKNEKE